MAETPASLLSWTHAWCEGCNRAQPFNTEVLPEDASTTRKRLT
jgi:hypothetical protein